MPDGSWSSWNDSGGSGGGDRWNQGGGSGSGSGGGSCSQPKKKAKAKGQPAAAPRDNPDNTEGSEMTSRQRREQNRAPLLQENAELKAMLRMEEKQGRDLREEAQTLRSEYVEAVSEESAMKTVLKLQQSLAENSWTKAATEEATVGELRAENAAVMSQLREENAAVMSQLREESAAAMSQLREENTAAMGQLREETAAVVGERDELEEQLQAANAATTEQVRRGRHWWNCFKQEELQFFKCRNEKSDLDLKLTTEDFRGSVADLHPGW